MRFNLIAFCMVVMSSALFAQTQERQMQKFNTLQQGQPIKNTTVVRAKPVTQSAPRQMATLGSQPVSARAGTSGTANRAPGQERKMVPLNPDKTIPKKN